MKPAYDGLIDKRNYIGGTKELTFKCGHTEQVDISEYGYMKEEVFLRDMKKFRDCPTCEKQKKIEAMKDYDEIIMSYSEYKNYYANCNVLKNSYNKINQTILVFVPKDMEYYKNKAIRNKIPIQRTHILDVTKQLNSNTIKHNVYFEENGMIYCETSMIRVEDLEDGKKYIESKPTVYQIDHTNSSELFYDILDTQYKHSMTHGVLDCFKERHKNILSSDDWNDFIEHIKFSAK